MTKCPQCGWGAMVTTFKAETCYHCGHTRTQVKTEVAYYCTCVHRWLELTCDKCLREKELLIFTNSVTAVNIMMTAVNIMMIEEKETKC